MINIRWYLAKIKSGLAKKRFNKGFFFTSSHKRNIERNKIAGVPVIVLDLYTNKSVKYNSITQAAKSFNTHPKTIWRKVQNKQRYLERYLIIEKYNYFSGITINMIEYLKIKLKLLIINYTIVLYVVLIFILLGYIFYKYVPYIIILYTDIYNNYIDNVDKVKVDEINSVWEHKPSLKIDIFDYLRAPLLNNKVNGLIDFYQEWKCINILKNKSPFIVDFSAPSKPQIYQSIINEINLDFRAKTNAFPTSSSSHSSPIIERVNINNIFTNAITSMSSTDTTISGNSLRIQTQGINSNRNFFIIDNLLYDRPSTRELLNYESNILYCMINGISPSII